MLASATLLIWLATRVTVVKATWNDNKPQVWNTTDWMIVDLNDEYEFGKPFPNVFNEDDFNEIFVGISAFRDADRCGKTVFLLFDKANNADRVFVGVVDQKDNEDEECLKVFCRLQEEKYNECKYIDQVQHILVDASASKGPVFARAKQNHMLRDEEFCLQVDAHSEFVDNWDDELIKEWMSTENENAVLSTYVHHIDRLPVNDKHFDVPHICRTKWGEGGMVRNEQACSAVRLPRPKLTFTWGAGLSFSKCHAVRRVPYDPYLPQVFDGEEFSIATRLFTHGYDVYTPSRNLVFHDYTPVPKHWSGSVDIELMMKEKKKSWQRLRTLWHMEGASNEDLGIFGLGSCRTFQQLVDFSGVDPRIGKASTGDKCAALPWIPWNNINCQTDAPPQSPRHAHLSLEQIAHADHDDHLMAFDSAHDIDDSYTPPMIRFKKVAHMEQLTTKQFDLVLMFVAAMMFVLCLYTRRRRRSRSMPHLPQTQV